MNLYAVEMGKKEYETLQHDAGFPEEGRVSKYGWNCGGLRPYDSYADGSRRIIRFRRLKDANAFAIWAAGWIAACWNNGGVPTLNVLTS
jgi:hypothetical protein